jgi:hypothetical protein
MVYDFNKNKYPVPGSGKRSKLGSSPSPNQTKSLKLTRSQYTGNELIPPLGEVEDSRSTELPSQIEEPTQVAIAIVDDVTIGGVILIIAVTGAVLSISWKDPQTGKEYTIGSYTVEQIANVAQFTSEVTTDIWNAVGDQLQKAGITPENLKQKFTKIIDENLGKIPGFDLDPGLETAPHTGHTGEETRDIPQGTPGFDIESGRSRPEDLQTGRHTINENLSPQYLETAPEFDGGQTTESGFLNAVERFLGPNYIEASPGRYVSADRTRQVRYGRHESVTSPRHHGHFEAYDRPGGRVIQNTSVEILPDP